MEILKKIHWKSFNLAAWITVLLAYVLPFETVSDGQNKVGFPIAFISVHDGHIGLNPLMSFSLNPISFLADVLIFYFIIVLLLKLYCKFIKK